MNNSNNIQALCFREMFLNDQIKSRGHKKQTVTLRRFEVELTAYKMVFSTKMNIAVFIWKINNCYLWSKQRGA